MLNQAKINWRRLLPGIIISVVSLGVVFYFIDLNRFFQALRQADYRFVALLFLMSVVWMMMRSVVWRTLLCEQATYSQVFLTLNEGYLLNNILPFRLGEVGRAFLLSKKANLGFLQVFSTILIERSLDVAFAAGLLLATLPFVVHSEFGWQAAMIAGGIVVLGLLALHFLARYQEWALNLFDGLTLRLPFLGRILKRRQLKAFFSGLEVLTNARRFLKVVLLMALNWLIALIQFFFLLRAFFPASQMLWSAFTVSVMSLGIAAPSSPGAIGVMEIAIVGALSAFNLDPSTSLAAALTAHLSNYLVTGVIGAYALARDGLTLTGLYQDVSRISSAEQDQPE